MIEAIGWLFLLALVVAVAVRQERIKRAHDKGISRARGDLAALARQVHKRP